MSDRMLLYLDLAARRPEAFANPDPQGIQIILDPPALRSSQVELAEIFALKGWPQEWTQAGIYYEDPWLYVVRDIVRFPDGGLGTYHHIILKGGVDGVVIFPVFRKRIVLLRHFRNGSRQWSLEVPRGGPRSDVSPIQNARDEMLEELGATPTELKPIGKLRNNNGMVTELMHIYFAEISGLGETNRAEGIDGLHLVSPEELDAMILDGTVDDSHTVHAFMLARLHGLI